MSLAGMNPVERRGFEQDHAEALVIDRQLAVAHELGLESTAAHIFDFNAFCQERVHVANYGIGFQVPRMQPLWDVGLIAGGDCRVYVLTRCGEIVREEGGALCRSAIHG